jgi:hypothetical protein
MQPVLHQTLHALAYATCFPNHIQHIQTMLLLAYPTIACTLLCYGVQVHGIENSMIPLVSGYDAAITVAKLQTVTIYNLQHQEVNSDNHDEIVQYQLRQVNYS